jgi:hypothetical protein
MAENKNVLIAEDDQHSGEKGMTKYTPDKNIRLTEEARETLKNLKRKPGLLAHASLQAIREAVGADAFDSLTLDRMHKQMLAGYKEYEPQWPKLVSKTTSINDFRTRYSIIHSGFNRLPEVKAKESYKELQYSDDQINWTPKKYGGMYGYSFEASTYDDLGMFDDDVRKLGQATNRTLDFFFFYTCLDANPTSYDGSNAIFGTVGSTAGTFVNTMTTTGLNYTNLETAVTTMLQQTQLDSSATFTDANYMPAMYIPKFLIVHPSDLLTAKRMLFTPNWPGKADNDLNVLPELQIMVSPYITGTHWYLMADPGQGANTMEVGLWGGNATPELFYEPANTGHGFAFDEVRTKIRTIFGGAVLDPRAWILGST